MVSGMSAEAAARTGWASPPSLVPAGVSAGALLVVAGFATTWARYESLAGEGWYAVGAAEQSTLLADGAQSLVDALLFAGLAVAVGLLAVVLWSRVIARQARNPSAAVRAGHRGVRWMRDRPITAHLLIPAVLVAAAGLPPAALGYAAAAVALVLASAGIIRLAGAVFDAVWAGESRVARWGRVPFALGWLAGLASVVGSWRSITGVVTYIGAFVIGACVARAHPELRTATAVDLVKAQWPVLVVMTLAGSALFSVASVADRRDGLRLVDVHERGAQPWRGYELGVRGGRSAFLRADGLEPVELPPGSLARVELVDTDARASHRSRTLAQRLLDAF